jgi:hypothetical protein
MIVVNYIFFKGKPWAPTWTFSSFLFLLKDSIPSLIKEQATQVPAG